MILTETQKYTIGNALRVAAERFEGHVKALAEMVPTIETRGEKANCSLLAEQFAKQAREARDMAESIENADRVNVEEFAFHVVDGMGELTGRYETLAEARGAVGYDRMRAYSIWNTLAGVRLEHCEDYAGDDDRVRQGLGLANASERV